MEKTIENGGSVLSRVAKLLSTMGFGGGEATDARKRDHLSRTDFGVLQVSLMIAALDGVILPDEYDTFDRLARKCRGYSEQTAAEALDGALHSAGYLQLQSGRVDTPCLVELFANEAETALPSGFAYGSPVDVRRAFVMWTAMGMSDGEFSNVERLGILRLKERFAEIKREKFAADVDCWSSFAITPSGEVPFVSGQGRELSKSLKLIPDDFLNRSERLLARMGSIEDESVFAKALAELILGGKE